MFIRNSLFWFTEHESKIWPPISKTPCLYIYNLWQECHNSKSVIFQENLLKVLKCYNFLWVQRRHNCSPAASFTNCVMTLYLLKVHLQTFLSVSITQKCQILSCDSCSKWATYIYIYIYIYTHTHTYISCYHLQHNLQILCNKHSFPSFSFILEHSNIKHPFSIHVTFVLSSECTRYKGFTASRQAGTRFWIMKCSLAAILYLAAISSQ